MSVVRVLMILIGCLWICATQAILITDLYEANVSVASRGAQERQQAMAVALQQVLIKVSGATVPASHPQLQAARDNPDNYVKLFQYREGAANTLQLEVQFQPDAINALVSRMKLPIWPANRPLTMVWLAMEAPDRSKHLLGAETDPALMDQLQALAKTWGIPVVIPVLDLAEVSQITATEVWEQNPEVVQQASARYGSDAVLMGRLEQARDNNTWNTTWKLVINQETNVWESQSSDFATALQTGLQGLAEQLASRFSMQNQRTASEGLLIEVVGMPEYHQYLQLTRYLQQLPQARTVRVVRLTGDTCVIWIMPVGDASAFKQAVALDRHLVPVTPADPSAMMLRYRFIP